MPSVIDDEIEWEAISIVRCGDLEDNWCTTYHAVFARDSDGNILQGKNKSTKIDNCSIVYNMGVDRWQRLECWGVSHPATTRLFEGVVHTTVVLSANKTPVTPRKYFFHDDSGDSRQTLLEGLHEFNCKDQLTILSYIFHRNFQPNDPFQLTLQYITIILLYGSCEHCQCHSVHH